MHRCTVVLDGFMNLFTICIHAYYNLVNYPINSAIGGKFPYPDVIHMVHYLNPHWPYCKYGPNPF